MKTKTNWNRQEIKKRKESYKFGYKERHGNIDKEIYKKLNEKTNYKGGRARRVMTKGE